MKSPSEVEYNVLSCRCGQNQFKVVGAGFELNALQRVLDIECEVCGFVIRVEYKKRK